MNNVRSNRWIELDGERHTLAQWSRLTGMHSTLIGWRLDHGWTIREALSTTRGRRAVCAA